MKKVIVIGCPGSGKSTFSKKLHKITGLPLYHLDMMNWNADKTTVPKPVFLERLQRALEEDCWIIDGNYGSTMKLRFAACDTVFFLDYPLEVCLAGVSSRKGKPRSDIPWFEAVDEQDDDFIEFIKNYNSVSKPQVLQLLEEFSHKDIYIFQSRERADTYLSQLKKVF